MGEELTIFHPYSMTMRKKPMKSLTALDKINSSIL